jgi:hypothetical protein
MSIPEKTNAFGAANRRGGKALRIAGLVVAGLAVAVLFAFLFGLIFKALWNALMPSLFGLSAITYWQAVGIVLLAKILFGGPGHARRDPGRRIDRRAGRRFWQWTCGDDATAGSGPVPGNGKRWSHFRQYWQDEGRAAFEAYLKKMDAGDSDPSASA